MPSRPVTQSQIAFESGVSQSAVSAILAGANSRNLSRETQTKVLAVAEKLGYVRKNSFSKSNAEIIGRQTVLIVESEPVGISTNEEWVESAYQTALGKILTTSTHCLQRRGIGLSIFHLGEPDKLMQWLADSDICGVLWHATDSNSALLHWVASRFPLVLLNRTWKSTIPFDSVSVNQEQNISIPAEHLWEKGHRRIATFGHSPTSSGYRRRISAYSHFIEERGLRNYREFQDISDAVEIPAIEKVQNILETWKGLGSEAPTALITSDVFALPLLREAKVAGINVPGELSIIGIDNTLPCSLMEPALTSMEESFDELCRIAVDLLLRRKANQAEPAISVQVSPKLVARNSVKPLTPLKEQKRPQHSIAGT